jgi:predicted flap endonuclease-1-like 5' DNA nuclease
MGAAAFRRMREQNERLASKEAAKKSEDTPELELVKVSGIGRASAEKLKEAGITTIEDLAEYEASDLVKQKWIDAAIELI